MKDDSVIRDPAFAAAAGKCWIARMMGGRVGSALADHPEECAFCEFPPEYLVGRIEEFMHWAGLNPVDEFKPGEPMVRPLRSSVEVFQMLPTAEQQRLVRRAQGQTEERDSPSDVWRR